jgi:hypothetical protein
MTATLFTVLISIIPVLSFAGDDKYVLKYSVTMDGQGIGSSKAVIEETGEGMVVTFGMKADVDVFGHSVKISSKLKHKFDVDGDLEKFAVAREGPMGKRKVKGERMGDGGYEITHKQKGKPKTTIIGPDEFDFHSADRRLFEGEVGSKHEYAVLVLGLGEVREVKVKILDREKRTVKGEQVDVVHFKAWGMEGSATEEWRTEHGVLVKSIIKTPLGKIVVELKDQN